jgi:hypothetical protein
MSFPELMRIRSFPLLAKLRRALFWNFVDYTDDETRRWLSLRSIEWMAWPSFVSQPIIPILLITYTWWQLLLIVIFVEIIWTPLRYRFVSFYLVELGVFFVKLKWPASIISFIYLLTDARYGTAILALLWPLVAAVIGVPGKVGRVESVLAKRIGYVAERSDQ